MRSRILEVRDLLKTSHPLLSQKLQEPLDSTQEGTRVLYITLSTPTHSLSLHISDITYELVDKMKTLEDLTSTIQEREGII